MIMGGSSLLSRTFKRCLPFGVFVTIFYIFLGGGLVDIILKAFIINASTFTIALISLYVMEAARSTSKIIVLPAILPILFIYIYIFTDVLIRGELSDPLHVGKAFTEMLYLTIAYIPFAIFYYLNIKEKVRKG